MFHYCLALFKSLLIHLMSMFFSNCFSTALCVSKGRALSSKSFPDTYILYLFLNHLQVHMVKDLCSFSIYNILDNIGMLNRCCLLKPVSKVICLQLP